MVTIHRYGLGKTNSDKSVTCIVNKYREIFFTGTPPKNKKIWKILILHNSAHFAHFAICLHILHMSAHFVLKELFSCSLALLLLGQSHLETLLCPEMASWLSTSQIGFLHDGNSEFYIENDEDVGSFPNNFISEHLKRATLILTLTSKCPKYFHLLIRGSMGLGS